MLAPYRKKTQNRCLSSPLSRGYAEPIRESSWLKKVRSFFFLIVVLGIFVSVEVIQNIFVGFGNIYDGFKDTRRFLSCGEDGVLRTRLGSFGRVARILCEVETELETSSFEEAFPEVDVSTTYIADYNTSRPSGNTNVAFVVTIPSCPEDPDHPTAADDPGPAAFYDAAAVLRDSICNCTARNPDSGSNYDSTFYAVIHPDAVNCVGPPSGNQTGRRALEESYMYDRVAILEELGYWVIIWADPFPNPYTISDSNLRNAIDSGEGLRALMDLYAYKLTTHPIGVMVSFDTTFLDPVDTFLDQMANDASTKTLYSTKSDGLVNTGLTFFKPSLSTYDDIINTIETASYDQSTGLGGSGILDTGADGILTYYFQQDSTANILLNGEDDIVNSFENHPVCGKPWDCKYQESWDNATKSECQPINFAWYTFRKHFELENWGKTDVVEPDESDQWFLGYCQNGYESGAHYTAAPTSAAPTTAEPTTAAPTTDAPTTQSPTAAPTHLAIIKNGGFENGTYEWNHRGHTVSMATSTEEVVEGTYSVLISNPSENWHGLYQDIKDDLTEGLIEFNGWLRLRNETERNMLFQLVIHDDGVQYKSVVELSRPSWTRVSNIAWFHFWGVMDVSFNGAVTSATIAPVFEYDVTQPYYPDYYVDGLYMHLYTPSTIIKNGGFEEGDIGWMPFWFGSTNIEATTEDARTGDSSLLITGREFSWKGAAQNMKMDPLMVPGTEYEFTAWVKLKNGTSESARASIEYQDDSGSQSTYGPLYVITSGEWTRLNVNFDHKVANGTVSSFWAIIHGPSPYIDFYIDDVMIIPATPSPTFQPTTFSPTIPGAPLEYVYNGDMERSTHWWEDCCGNHIGYETTTEQVYEGNHSLLTSGRAYNWDGPSQDLIGRLIQPGKYEMSAWMRIKDPNVSGQAQFFIDQFDESGTTYYYPSYIPRRNHLTTIYSDKWTRIWGVIDFNVNGTSSHLSLRFALEGDALYDFYVDSVSMIPYEPNTIVHDGGFEKEAYSWFPLWFGGVEITATPEAARTGSRGLLVTGRSFSWNGAAQSLTGLMPDDALQVSEYYRYSAWVKLKNGTSENFRIGFEMNDDSPRTYINSDIFVVNNETWTEVWDVFRYEPNGTVRQLFFTLNGPSPYIEYYIDDVSIIPFATPAPTTAAPTTSQPSYHPTTSAPSVAGAYIHPPVGYIATAVPGDVNLGISYPGELLLLSQVITTDGIRRTPIPAGRSYDGNDWESVDPLHLPFGCSTVACATTLPAVPGETVEYTIIAYQPDALDQDQVSWRLLQQATFGPTQDSITEAGTMDESDWVKTQMELVPTSHRAHYRTRVATRLRQDAYLFGGTNACDPGSRWNQYTFNKMDRGKTIIEELTSSNTYALRVDGFARTELNLALETNLTGPWKICEVDDYVGGSVVITTNDGDCSEEMQTSSFENPAVNFVDSSNTASIDSGILLDLDPYLRDVKILDSISEPCTLTPTWPNFLRDSADNSYYVSDRRVRFQNNDISVDAAMSLERQNRYRECPTAPKTFMNEGTCVPRLDCGAPVYSSAMLELNAENVRKFYTLDGLYVYKVDINDITPDDGYDNPCTISDSPHRFVRRQSTGGCSGGGTNLDQSIINAITYHINETLQTNSDALAIDVWMTSTTASSVSCTDESDLSVGAEFEVGSSCWTHSHPDSWSVFDLSVWTLLHPGNDDAHDNFKRNPIAKWAERYNDTASLEDSVTLVFPSWKNKLFFDQNRWQFTELGKWGDTVDFANFGVEVQGPNVADHFGATQIGYDGYFEVCGGVNEVSNDPFKGDQYLAYLWGEQGRINTLDQDHPNVSSKNMIWTTVTRNALDQMRQRVAWAFASIFVITETAVGFDENAEGWSNYYDIFVRNAFGNFFDILKEVAFNPLMAIMLTYEQSRSYAYNIEYKDAALFPDENFAREIMQLFTIGLWKLHQNGTQVIDENTGMPIPTYDNNDIVELSRGWTNMVRQHERGNVEASYSLNTWNPGVVDPMRLPNSDGRDVFPKLGLHDKGKRVYLGDKVKRCDAMPPQAFLKKGAKYQFRGDNPTPHLARGEPVWMANYGEETWFKHLILDNSTSQLYNALCDPDPANGDACRFSSTVTLQEDLSCSGTCSADRWGLSKKCECNIDQPRIVRIDPSAATGSNKGVHYEYVPEECVQMAFPEPENVGAVAEAEGDSGIMCADKRLPAGGSVCCDYPDGNNANAISQCVFRGERTTFETAEQRCLSLGMHLCDWNVVESGSSCSYETGGYGDDHAGGFDFTWSNATCTMKAQINMDGKVAIIHDASSFSKPIKGRVALDTGTYFRVLWGGDGSASFPTYASNCENIPTCTLSGNTCVCDVTTVEIAKFDGTAFPSTTDLMDNLHIGSLAPNEFQNGTYHICTAPLCAAADFDLYTTGTGPIVDDQSIVFDKNTIFEIKNHNGQGDSLFLANSESNVEVGGGFYFRNPPMYNSPVDQAQRDGLYELDDLLNHYFRHSNTAPFVSKNLIKLLVTANPSPRYVEAVANAFASGLYEDGSNTFGTGKYGDLAATVAAIFLDREARSSILDEDPTNGLAREPIIKVMHLIRALDLNTANNVDREIQFYELQEKLGQDVHQSPSVFSFFSPDYQPAGPVFEKGLVAPAAQLFDAPQLIGFLNGLSNLFEFGLSDCVWPGALGHWDERLYVTDEKNSGHFNCWEGNEFGPNALSVPFRFRWSPQSNNSSQIVSDLDMLMTGGRLQANNKAIMVDAYNKVVDESSDAYGHERALKAVQKLMATTPEFHTTNNLVDHQFEPQQLKPSNTSGASTGSSGNVTEPVTGYKAIVYLFLLGGVDSYNLLIPHSNCGTSTLPEQYTEVRGDVAIPLNDLLTFNDANGNQVCTTFGTHPRLTHIHQLYQSGDVAWIANMGNQIEPVTKAEFEAKTKELPPALFAHNTQTDVTQTVHAQNAAANGVLGRIGEIINRQENGEVVNSYSLRGTPKVLKGSPGLTRPADVLTGNGLSGLGSAAVGIEPEIRALQNQSVTSMYGETYSEAMRFTFERIDVLGEALEESILQNGECAASVQNADGDSVYLAHEFEQVSRIIGSRDALQSTRDIFYLAHWGYDTHSDNGPALIGTMTEVNGALSCFTAEMISQGIWNNVTVIMASEFGRTMTSNGRGTDHAWGGNYFIMGGDVDGGRIHGTFPDDLTENDELNIGRGRLIPTTAWEELWYGVAQWFGVDEQNMAEALPNLQNFASPINATTLYNSM